MKNLIKRNRFTGYKGMDRMFKKNAGEITGNSHLHPEQTEQDKKTYWLYLQSNPKEALLVDKFYIKNTDGKMHPVDKFSPNVKWVSAYVSTGDGVDDFKIDTWPISEFTVLKDSRLNLLSINNVEEKNIFEDSYGSRDTNTYLKPSTMAESAVANNPFIGDNFFNANPEKVLGVQTIEHGKWGNDIIKVKGDFNLIEKIDVPAVAVIDLYPTQIFASENKQEIINQVFEKETVKANEKRLEQLRAPGKKSKKETASENLQGSQEVYSFREFSDLYNKDISRDEMEAYYFTHPELNYKLLLDEIRLTKQEMINKGLICWDEGKFVYIYTYQSGNVGKKIMNLKRDREKLIGLTSEEQYNRQLAFLEAVRPREKSLVGDDKLMVLPHSQFAKNFMISELRGKPELNSRMSLTEAFKRWLRVQPPDMFDRSGYIEIIDYYIDNKVIPIDKNSGKIQQVKDEKNAINIRQRTKDEGDKLFGIFLAEDLLPEDQSKFSHLWNEKYNSFAEPNLAKTPICLRMAKTFKAGAPLILNPTQRQAPAFMQEKQSGLLAYGVGVGKANLLTSKLVTPKGFVNMGDIKLGDFVIGKNGHPTQITGVFPQGKKSCYEVIFSDGSKTEVSDEHLWNVQRIKQRDHKSPHWNTMTTVEMLKSGLYNKRGNYMFSIPMVEPIHFDEQSLIVDAYIMGCLIGNGTLGTPNTVGISLAPVDMIERVENNLPDSVKIYKNKGDNVDFDITRKSLTTENNVVYREIQNLELNHKANGKFIPEKYMFNSLENRIKLLQGLIDTDGWIKTDNSGKKKGCTIIYNTVSERLAKDVKFLCETFGGTASIKLKEKPKFTYKGEKKIGQPCYSVSLRLPAGIMPVFTKEKVKKFVVKTKYQPTRFVKAINYIGEHECQCISVAAEDHLYVVDDCIVTHNTISSILCMAQAFYNGFCKRPLFVVPTNTYDNWIAELQGKVDKQTGQFMQGIMPQLPPVVGLYNLNPVIVKEQLKVYSKQDELKFEQIERTINAIKTLGNIEEFEDWQTEALSEDYPINFRGLKAEFNIARIEGKGLGRAKTFPEFVINYLKDEYNYYIYALGTIKNFPDGTVFVTTENGLQRLGVSQKNKKKLESSIYEILSQGEKTADSDSKRDKEIAKLQLMVSQRISSSMKNAKLNIEDIGLDWVCMDEAHYYKKLFTFVKGDITSEYEDYKTGDTKFKRDKTKYELKSGGAPSGRALSAFVVSHFIQMEHNYRNVVMLTATPFTNSPLEVYSMLALTNLNALKELGLSNMVEFFDTFMKINYDIKYTPQKTVKKDIVLTGYNNLSNLRQVIYSIMDKKDEGANLKRPIKLMYPSLEKGIETTIPMTVEQNDLIAQVKSYVLGHTDLSLICQESVMETIAEMDFDSLDDEELITEWEKYTGKDFEGDRDRLTDNRREALIKQIQTSIKNDTDNGVEFNEKDLDEKESLGVRILRGISMMKQITLSPYLFHKACSKVQGHGYVLPNYKDFINTSPKLKYTMGCIKSVIDFHKSRNEKISGQVIYMANGVEYFPLVKEYLVKELHLKDSEVGIVSGGMSKAAKESVKAKFLNGDCKVLIGSQTISVGVNLQNNATVLYNLWFDWNPTDAAQIEGRIWRQGNRFKFVRIVYPMCYNSCDPVIFEYLNAKTLRINEIWNRSSEIQELDLKDFNPKELQRKLITDPEEKAQLEVLEESDKLQGEILYFENRRNLLVGALTAFKNFTRLKPMAIKEMNAISAKRAELKKAQAIKNNSEKLVEITEKFAAEPEKMVEEIKKYNAEKYDHAADPDGRYMPTDYTDMSNLEIVEASAKMQGHLAKVDYKDAEAWGDIYWSRNTINDTLDDLRYNYRDLKVAEERVLKPLHISFDSATNPIREFEDKLLVLNQRLNAIEEGYPAKVEKYRREYEENLKTIKTVDDRIAEFAAANDQLLPPQLVDTNVEDIPHEEIPPVENNQQAEEPIKELPPAPIETAVEEELIESSQESTELPPVAPVFHFMADSPMHQGKALGVLTTRIRDENNKVVMLYEWIEAMPAGLEVDTVKINSYRSDKGFTNQMVIGNHIVKTKAEQEYYKYLQAGGESYSAYLVKKKVYDDIIKIQKDAERKIADDKREERNIVMRENAKKLKEQTLKSLIVDGKQPFIDRSTKYFIEELDQLKKGRKTEESKKKIERLEENIGHQHMQAEEMHRIATELYYLDEEGHVVPKFNWQIGDSILWHANSVNYIKTKIASIRENLDGGITYKVEPAEGIYNEYVGYDGIFPIPGSENTETPASTEDLKTTINNQIEALTLAREFTEPDKLEVIDSQIEALTLTLNFI